MQSAVSQAAKYIARHVSVALPNDLPARTSSNDDETNTNALRNEFIGFDTTILPPYFKLMVDTFLAGGVLELPELLYEAAFARERLGFAEFMNLMVTEGGRDGIIRDLLSGVGYEVE